MTEERKLAGEVEASRDPLKEARRTSLDEERVAGDGERRDEEDARKRARAAAIAATAGQSGFS